VLVGAELHPWETLRELAAEAPVGGRLAVIQQACLGHPERPGGLAADRAAGGVPLAQPGRDLRVTLA